MTSLEKAYLTYFKETFDQLGLEEYENSHTEWPGALMKFKNSAMRLRLLSDRGIIETELSPIFGIEEFKGIETIKAVLTLSKRGKQRDVSETDEKEIRGPLMGFELQCEFLRDNYVDIVFLLSEKNYRNTLSQIQYISQVTWPSESRLNRIKQLRAKRAAKGARSFPVQFWRSITLWSHWPFRKHY